MNKEDTLEKLKIDREFCERQVRQSIATIRSILNRVEDDLDNQSVKADNGLQGNEWRLYKELSNLERLDDFIKTLENMKD